MEQNKTWGFRNKTSGGHSANTYRYVGRILGTVDVWLHKSRDANHGYIVTDEHKNVDDSLFNWTGFTVEDDTGNIEIYDNDVVLSMPETVELYNIVAQHWPTGSV
jgi:hypothetical protein